MNEVKEAGKSVTDDQKSADPQHSGNQAEINFHVSSTSAEQNIFEIQLWKPSQGTTTDCFPVDLEVRFSEEVIFQEDVKIVVSLKRADLGMTLNNCRVVRNSRLGDQVQREYEATKICIEISDQKERDRQAGVEAQASIERTYWGSFKAYFHEKILHKSSLKYTQITDIDTKLSRIIAEPNNKWFFVEPMPPRILKGTYLGPVREEHKELLSKPICLLEATSGKPSAKLVIGTAPEYLDFKAYQRAGAYKETRVSRNKEALVGILARRCCVRQGNWAPGVQANANTPLTLGHADIWVEDEN